MRAKLSCVVILTVLTAFGPVLAGTEPEDKNWAVELGVMVGYHNNFFYRSDADDKGAPDTALYGVYTSGELAFEAGRNNVTLYYDVSGTAAGDIDSADQKGAATGIEYRRGRTRISGEYAVAPNVVYFEEDEEAFYDVKTFSLELRQKVGRATWIGGKYRIAESDFNSASPLRNASAWRLSVAARFPLGARVGLRPILYSQAKDAEGPKYTWSGKGVGLAVDARPTDRLELFQPPSRTLEKDLT